MFKTSGRRKKKTTAQAMVEFALALPVLLLVIYGLIESGRLLFIYASVVTAARNAARYGSATGNNASGTPYYQDCTGITAAANNVAFINKFSSINISYDAGLDSGGNPILFTGGQAGNASCSQDASPSDVQNGWRINVSVSTQYAPIVPLVPFGPFTITSMSSRTLLGSVSIGVTAPPQTWTGSGGVNLQVTTDVSSYSFAGQVIHFTYIITNTSGSKITSPAYSINDNLVTSTNCSGAASPLDVGASTQCTGTYTITQADLDNGSISGIASATVSAFVSNTVNTTLYADQKPSLSLTKTASVAAAAPGQTVTYTYTIKNTGNVTLQSITTNDSRLGSVCSVTSLAPNATYTCNINYHVTKADGDAGTITNTAQSTATFAAKTYNSNSASVTVVTTDLVLGINAPTSVTPVVGQPFPNIPFTFALGNATNQSMSPNFTVDAKTSTGTSIPTSPNPCSNQSLAKNSYVTCTGSYTVTQSDVDNGQVAVTATGYGNNGAIKSNTFTLTVIVNQSPQITLTVTPSTTLATTVGTVVNYTYTLQNSGNVTLYSPFSITDNVVTNATCAGATSPLAPGASTTCTGSYTITQADIDAGSVIDQATASGSMPNGFTVTSATATSTVITYTSPRLTLQKTANPTLANSAGQVVTYTYTLQNTGNTALIAPFTVTDNKIGSANCSAAVSPILVGGSTTCTGSYTVTAADITAGSVTNIATASAVVRGTNTTLTSNQASATVQTGAIACDPRHSGIQTSPFSMTIFNESASATITISQIQVYFNTNPTGQFISTMQYGGVTIWAGAATGSPGVFTVFSGDVTLQAGKNKLLGLTFNKNYIPSNPPIERIIVTFVESGCPVLDSNNNNQLP